MSGAREYYQWIPWVGSPPEWVKEATRILDVPSERNGALMRIGDELHLGTEFGVQVLEPRDWLVLQPDGAIYKLTRREMDLIRASEGGPL